MSKARNVDNDKCIGKILREIQETALSESVNDSHEFTRGSVSLLASRFSMQNSSSTVNPKKVQLLSNDFNEKKIENYSRLNFKSNYIPTYSKNAPKPSKDYLSTHQPVENEFKSLPIKNIVANTKQMFERRLSQSTDQLNTEPALVNKSFYLKQKDTVQSDRNSPSSSVPPSLNLSPRATDSHSPMTLTSQFTKSLSSLTDPTNFRTSTPVRLDSQDSVAPVQPASSTRTHTTVESLSRLFTTNSRQSQPPAGVRLVEVQPISAASRARQQRTFWDVYRRPQSSQQLHQLQSSSSQQDLLADTDELMRRSADSVGQSSPATSNSSKQLRFQDAVQEFEYPSEASMIEMLGIVPDFRVAGCSDSSCEESEDDDEDEEGEGDSSPSGGHRPESAAAGYLNPSSNKSIISSNSAPVEDFLWSSRLSGSPSAGSPRPLHSRETDFRATIDLIF